MRFLLLVCFLLAPSANALAAFVSPGDCLAVLASRPTLAAAEDYRVSHPEYDISAIYLSSNGWFALTGDMLDEDEADARLNSMKAGGLIPGDSFCSSGKGLVERVWPATSIRPASPPDLLFSEFDARPLDRDEKRFLQASLALTGDYDGRLDGQWGRGSQSALDRWSLREFGELPSNFHVAFLAAAGSEMLEADDWDVYYDSNLDISLLAPFAIVYAGDTDERMLEILSDDDSFAAVAALTDRASAIGFHEMLIANASGVYRTEPYIVRRDDFWVTSYAEDGHMAYQRTDFSRGTGLARMALFTAETAGGRAVANLMVASYRTGGQRPLQIPPAGRLMTYMKATLDVLSADDEAAPATESNPAQTTSQARSSGSGFYINDAADVMTNAHVVEGCGRLAVDGAEAALAAVDARLDLAILRRGSRLPEEAEALAFAATPARLNSDVTVAGFPLKGLLDTLNVTRGSVSALKGMDNDATRLQITAPVQAGNSGGPIVNRHGQVVGVVVSKMNGLTVAELTGDLPQNVNFAVRGSIARIFAEANNISTSLSGETTTLSPEALAEQLSRATVLIECY
ncbi:trypsin-like peptidase domain-containing protein [Martelella lutilitoris]|uniref:Trypsin-like peptidase domain-containing protein n=1 Tax=Martelella lutilitoris TaxID=2583532 RepID=A0A5C4JWA7_9HYPH|nr:serine protease [Martelella lutilitoris]TNB49534.1 trypsin-like peptidase domain-containing protein [Martelella lutilitoris]